MRLLDSLRYIQQTLGANPRRTFLTSLGITIGITSVVLLTALGQGVQRFIIGEFTQFGTHLLGIAPGKATTLGMSGAVISTVRPLTLDDAKALRHLPGVEAVTPVVQGNVRAEARGLGRRTTVIGVGPAAPEVWRFRVELGAFLPEDDLSHPRTYAVLGAKVRQALFGSRSPLGEKIRVGGESYRIIGVMEPKGQVLGFDLDDAVYIPAARALAMFDREGLMEIDVTYQSDLTGAEMRERVSRLLRERHGREDFTITTQEEMLAVLGDILSILTAAVGAIGGISLLVGSIGILSTMLIAVRDRTAEIGVLRALGARRRQILGLFIGEAVAIAAFGGISGLALGLGGATLIGWLTPVPSETSWPFVIATVAATCAVGLLAGVLPALRAARLQPVEALRDE